MKRIVSLVLPVMLIFAMLCGCAANPNRQISRRVDSFFTAVKKADTAAIQSLLGEQYTEVEKEYVTEDFLIIGGEEDEATMAENDLFKSVFSNMKWEIGETSISEDKETAYVSVKIDSVNLKAILDEAYEEVIGSEISPDEGWIDLLSRAKERVTTKTVSRHQVELLVKVQRVVDESISDGEVWIVMLNNDLLDAISGGIMSN